MSEMVGRVAKALWPWLRDGVPGCERKEWEEINRGSLAFDLATHAARAAIAEMETDNG